METVTNLVIALQQATEMAKQLPTTTEPPQILQIYSTLHAAHHHLSSFLAATAPPPPPPTVAADNSFSSAVGNDPENSPMQVGDDEEEVAAEVEQNPEMDTVETVEERMRNCFIQRSKRRRKRSLSPSAAAAAAAAVGGYEREFVRNVPEFDSEVNRLRALDLIYQFHS